MPSASKPSVDANLTDSARLELRLTEFGVAPTAEALAPTETITPETLSLLRERGPGLENETLASASVDPDAEGMLRISIADDENHSPGRRAADFALVSVLGEGGMGRVYLARQHSLAREIALKTVKGDKASAAGRALLREARVAGSLEHPGVVPIHVLAFDEAARPMLVMKRVDGVDLGTLLSNETHPAWKARGRSSDRLIASIEILIQVCLTLEFAHSRGILHRDIKPDNIMVGSFGEVYLLDWGIATLLKDGAPKDLVGTPTFIAPEMALGEPLDQRTDVYLLGATLHQVLTGDGRHNGKNINDVLRSAILSAPVSYPAGVPEELASLCNRATSRAPSARPASVEAFREELSAFIRSRSARALNEAALERLLELETMLAEPGPPKDIQRAYRLVTEARFGFALYLREHELDPAARVGMRRCLGLAVDLELRQEHAESAAALLREMDSPDPILEKMVEELRERTARFARERARLEHLEQELDPTQHSWRRGLWLVVGALIAVVVGRAVSLAGDPSPERIAAGGIVATILVTSILFLARKRVPWNAFNRRLIALITLGQLIIVGNRLVAVVYQAPAHQTTTSDMIIACGMALYGGFVLVPRIALAAIPPGLGVAAALFWPMHAPAIMFGAFAASLLVGAASVTVWGSPAVESKRRD